jgi:hypothetical protein
VNHITKRRIVAESLYLDGVWTPGVPGDRIVEQAEVDVEDVIQQEIAWCNGRSCSSTAALM